MRRDFSPPFKNVSRATEKLSFTKELIKNIPLDYTKREAGTLTDMIDV